MTKSVIITENLRDTVNGYLDAEFIPACAVGNELVYVEGNLIMKTFNNNGMNGYRKMDELGQIINIITESYR